MDNPRPKLKLTGTVFWSYGEELGLHLGVPIIDPFNVFGPNRSANVLVLGDGRQTYEVELSSPPRG